MKYLLALFLVGCSSVPQIETKEVKIPIAMPCIFSYPTKPDLAVPKLTSSDDLFAKVKALVSDNYLHIAYELELVATLKSCE